MRSRRVFAASTTAPTTAEIDYLLDRRLGDPARRAFLADLVAGRFTVGALEREGLRDGLLPVDR
jgi:hypothetical protein